MDIEKEMSEYQKKKEEKRKQFFKKCSDKIRKGELIYQALALYIAKRYNIDTNYLPNVIYIILNHYIENIEEDFETWIHKENSPLLRPAEQLPKIFPEIAVITTSEEQIIKIANNLYNLNLKYFNEEFCERYVYSLEFDFNSFTPININKVKELKEEIRILKKYGNETKELEEKIKNFGLTEEQIELL